MILYLIINIIEWIFNLNVINYIYSNKILFTYIKLYNIALKWGTANQIKINKIKTVKIYF